MGNKIGVLFIGIGFLGMLHQKLVGGGWFDLAQVWHHELFIVASWGLGAGCLFATYFGKR